MATTHAVVSHATLHLDDEPPSRVRAHSVPSAAVSTATSQVPAPIAHLDPLYRHTDREARAGWQGLSGSGDTPRMHSTYYVVVAMEKHRLLLAQDEARDVLGRRLLEPGC